MRGVGILFGVKYYVKMWKNTCNGGRLCYRKVKITSNINLTGGTTTITNQNGGNGIYNLSGNITVKSKLDIKGASNSGIKLGRNEKLCDGVITFSEGADVTIQNSHHGVATFTNTKSGEDKADVKINGGKLNISNTTSSGRSAGIYSANNRIEVSGGTVEIVDNSFAMDLPNGTVDISGNAKVNLTVNSDNHGAVATNSDSTIHLSEGGRATCTTQATCTVCATRYGAPDATNHSGTKGEWQKNESQHWKKYSCCGAEVDTLVPVSDLTKTFEYGKTKEPIFGGALIKDTDYTVSYAVKAGSAGELKDGKPYGAGTYVITVTGIGSCKDSFTKEFVIEKATQADEHEYLSAKSGEEKTEVILQPIGMQGN